jgi:hypothetical protein
VVVLQKLAYLYGWPDLCGDRGELDDDSLLVVTVFIGVMFGVGTATKVLGELAQRLSKQVLKRLPEQALTKWGFYRLAREVAKWLGVRLTKQAFARVVSKFVPIIGGFISGATTWIVFSRMAERLREHLAALPSPGGDNTDAAQPAPGG